MNIRDKPFSGHRALILLLIFSAVYISSTISLGDNSFISADAVYDAQIAKNILRGDGLGWQATLQPPMQGVLTAPVSLFTEDILSAGIIVSKFMWWLLPAAMYLLANALFSRQTAIIAATLTFFHPHFAFSSNLMEPIVTYPTFLLFASYFTWIAFSRKSYLFSMLGGLFFALAYLSRSEGFIIMVFFVMVILTSSFIESRKTGEFPGKIFVLALLLLSFTITSLPYLLFLKNTYGKPVISPKSTYVQIWMKSRIYHDNNLGETGNPELWGLSKNGKLMWQEPRGTSDLIRYLLSHPRKSLDVYISNMSLQIPGRIPNNSGQWLYPQVYPLYFVLPALYWLAVAFRHRENRKKTLYLLAPFPILLILPVFTEGWWKYLLPYSPFLILMATAGLVHFSEKIRGRRLIAPLFAITVVIYNLWAVKASQTYYPNGKSPVAHRVSMAEEQKKVGVWAQARFSGTPNYMLPWSKLAYYLNGRWTAMPVAGIYDTLKYAETNKVDYLIYEAQGRAQKDQLVAYFSRVPKMQLAQTYKSQTSGYHVLFFKLVPALSG